MEKKHKGNCGFYFYIRHSEMMKVGHERNASILYDMTIYIYLKSYVY